MDVDVRNIPSIKIFEVFGYKKERLTRQGKMVNIWCDYYIYDILNIDM